jgi:hypothetical protein
MFVPVKVYGHNVVVRLQNIIWKLNTASRKLQQIVNVYQKTIQPKWLAHIIVHLLRQYICKIHAMKMLPTVLTIKFTPNSPDLEPQALYAPFTT